MSWIEMFAGSMLSNNLEFRDDAGNEIAFFEKKKKKCSQSVAMVSTLNGKIHLFDTNMKQMSICLFWGAMLTSGDVTWRPRRSGGNTATSLSGREKLGRNLSPCRCHFIQDTKKRDTLFSWWGGLRWALPWYPCKGRLGKPSVQVDFHDNDDHEVDDYDDFDEEYDDFDVFDEDDDDMLFEALCSRQVHDGRSIYRSGSRQLSCLTSVKLSCAPLKWTCEMPSDETIESSHMLLWVN